MKSRSKCHLLGFFCCLKVGCSIWWQAKNGAILTLLWRSLHSCYFADCSDKVAQLNTLHFCCSTELISLWFLRVHKTRNVPNTGRLLPPTDDVFEWFVKKITTTHVVVFDSDGNVRCNKVMTGKLFRRKALFFIFGETQKLPWFPVFVSARFQWKPLWRYFEFYLKCYLKFTFFSLLHSTFSPKNDILHDRPGAG